MFLVGGGILTHGVPVLHRWIGDWGEDVGELPAVGAVFGALTPILLNAIAVYAGRALLRRLRTPAASRA